MHSDSRSRICPACGSGRTKRCMGTYPWFLCLDCWYYAGAISPKTVEAIHQADCWPEGGHRHSNPAPHGKGKDRRGMRPCP